MCENKPKTDRKQIVMLNDLFCPTCKQIDVIMTFPVILELCSCVICVHRRAVETGWSAQTGWVWFVIVLNSGEFSTEIRGSSLVLVRHDTGSVFVFLSVSLLLLRPESCY